MLVPSQLRATTLGDVLASLFRARASGVLELVADGRDHAIHLRGGLVHAVEGDATRFGDVCAELRVAGRDAIERAWRGRHAAHRIGQCLVSARVLSLPERDRVLEAQRARRLEALFAMPDAAVRFRAARALPAGAAEQPPMVPSRVFRGRPRTRDRGRLAVDPARAAALGDLGLAPDATFADARQRFRSLVVELHPDRCGDLPRGPAPEQRLRAVLDAWRALSGSPF